MNAPARTHDYSQVPQHLLDDVGVVDDYLQTLTQIQKAIVYASKQLKPTQVQMAKLHHKGSNFTEIAAAVGKAPTTVSKHLDKPEVQKLLSLLQYYEIALDGPSIAQRRNMLWRIAKNNEQVAPKTSISAIAEINKVDPVLAAQNSGNTGNSTINIQINEQILPRGVLDQ